MRLENNRRVKVIATTEAGKAISVSQQKTAEELQTVLIKKPDLAEGNGRTTIITPVVLVKSWRSQRDKAVRDSHVRADQRYTEEPIGIGEIFQVGASAGQFPRDPQLSADESIGCRCYLKLRKIT